VESNESSQPERYREMNLFSCVTQNGHVIDINMFMKNAYDNTVVGTNASNPIFMFFVAIGKFILLDACWYKN
jgi:hypothetical protein